MSADKITEMRLLELIAAYGGDVHAFPEAERAAARAMLAAQPERFAAAMADASATDDLLAGLPAIETPDALRAALIASAPRPRRQARRASGWRLPVWIPAGALASLAVGLFAGLSVAEPAVTQDDQAETLVYASLGLDDYTFGDYEDEATQ